MVDVELFLELLLILVGLAIPIVALAHRLRLPPLVGFFVAGVVVGPHGVGLIDGPDQIRTLSELGVALLLFAVGLELSLSLVRRWARSVFVGGGLQVSATLGAGALAAVALGVPPRQAIFYGALAAMSSTAIVTKAYADRAELDAPHGRAVISILLFQDLCILPLMLLLPLLAFGGDAAGGGLELARGLAIMAALVVGGRFLVRWTLDRVVLFRDRDLFTLCVSFFGIGAAVVTSAAGFSIAIGAFIAGLIISESEYGLQALSDVLPFRALFSGIFFTSLGMLLDIPAVLDQLPLLLLLSVVVVAVKAAIAAGVVLALGGMLKTALTSGLSLAQVGEFSILLAAAGLPLGLFRDGDYQLFLSVAVLSMMATPFFIHFAGPLAERVSARLGAAAPARAAPRGTLETLAGHTIIVGYGLAGRYLARVLTAAGITCAVVDQNPELVRRAREDGITVVYGDGTQPAVLEHVRLREARTIVFAIASPADERRGAAVARNLSRAVRIVVRTRYIRASEDLIELGANDVVVEEFEASIELFARALDSYEIPINRIWREVESVREEHYGLLRGKAAPDLRLDALRHLGIHEALELVEVEEQSPAIGGSATSLELRRRTGAVQLAVVRDGRPIYRRAPDFHYRAGDTVVLVGNPESLDRALALFRAATDPATA